MPFSKRLLEVSLKIFVKERIVLVKRYVSTYKKMEPHIYMRCGPT
jgi:hypothetical protein